jgi:hypothetical protein
VGRLLRHGELFADNKIEVQFLPDSVVISSGQIAIVDPFASMGGKRASTLARQLLPGKYRVMLCIAHQGASHRVAAAVMHVGRPPVARWVVAHLAGEPPPTGQSQYPGLQLPSGCAGFIDGASVEALHSAMTAEASGCKDDLTLHLRTAPPAGGWGHHAVVLDPEKQTNLVAFTGGGNARAIPTAYWGLDEASRPVCLVLDFDPFTAAQWKLAKRPMA